MTNKLFIGNLSRGTTSLQLQKHFEKAGKVLSAKVILDREGLGKGFGFVEMETADEAENAKKMLNHSELDGMSMRIEDEKYQP